MIKSNSKQSTCFDIELKDDVRNDYDGVDKQPEGDIYGDVNEDIDLQIIQNPYYGGEVGGPTALKTEQNPYYGEEI